MKILHLIDSFDARFERDQIKLIELLEKRGHHNTVITSNYSSDWRRVKKAEFKIWEKNFRRTEILHQPSLRIPTPFSRTPLPIYLPSPKIFYNFDVIHAYTLGTYSSILGAILKKANNFGFVIRSDLSPTSYYKAKRAQLYKFLVTYPFKIADAIYVYSELEKSFLNNLNISLDKIWVIPPGIDFNKFAKIPILSKMRDLKVGYLGRFCFVKGIHRLISVLCRLLREEKGIKVIFNGIIEDAEYATSVLKSLNKFKNFKYDGIAPSSFNFFSLCDIVLVPSLSETGAITVLEAMASGKVVIASNINPINTYIQHGYDGFLFCNEEEVYQYIKTLIENPELIRKMGKRAREKAKNYDWQHIIIKYENIYRNAVHHK